MTKFKIILITIILLSVSVYPIDSPDISETIKDSSAHSDDINSIEFTEVIEDVYIDESEHSLIIDSGSFKSTAYTDTSSVLQLIEVTKDLRWAILISMPAKIQGRVETSYILIDIKINN